MFIECIYIHYFRKQNKYYKILDVTTCLYNPSYNDNPHRRQIITFLNWDSNCLAFNRNFLEIMGIIPIVCLDYNNHRYRLKP